MLNRIRWIINSKFLEFRIPGFRSSIRTFSKNSSFEEYVSLSGKTTVVNCQIGRFTYLNSAKVGNAILGSFCSLGPEAIVGGLGRHPTNMASTHPSFYSRRGQCRIYFTDENLFEEDARTVIGHDVWIGTRAVVIDGVTVGTGAIVGAGAVVTKDVEPYSIVAGVPAKTIRMRYERPKVQRLLDSKWWESDLRLLTEIQPDIAANDLDGLLRKIDAERSST